MKPAKKIKIITSRIKDLPFALLCNIITFFESPKDLLSIFLCFGREEEPIKEEETLKKEETLKEEEPIKEGKTLKEEEKPIKEEEPNKKGKTLKKKTSFGLKEYVCLISPKASINVCYRVNYDNYLAQRRSEEENSKSKTPESKDEKEKGEKNDVVSEESSKNDELTENKEISNEEGCENEKNEEEKEKEKEESGGDEEVIKKKKTVDYVSFMVIYSTKYGQKFNGDIISEEFTDFLFADFPNLCRLEIHGSIRNDNKCCRLFIREENLKKMVYCSLKFVWIEVNKNNFVVEEILPNLTHLESFGKRNNFNFDNNARLKVLRLKYSIYGFLNFNKLCGLLNLEVLDIEVRTESNTECFKICDLPNLKRLHVVAYTNVLVQGFNSLKNIKLESADGWGYRGMIKLENVDLSFCKVIDLVPSCIESFNGKKSFTVENSTLKSLIVSRKRNNFEFEIKELKNLPLLEKFHSFDIHVSMMTDLPNLKVLCLCLIDSYFSVSIEKGKKMKLMNFSRNLMKFDHLEELKLFINTTMFDKIIEVSELAGLKKLSLITDRSVERNISVFKRTIKLEAGKVIIQNLNNLSNLKLIFDESVGTLETKSVEQLSVIYLRSLDDNFNCFEKNWIVEDCYGHSNGIDLELWLVFDFPLLPDFLLTKIVKLDHYQDKCGLGERNCYDYNVFKNLVELNVLNNHKLYSSCILKPDIKLPRLERMKFSLISCSKTFSDLPKLKYLEVKDDSQAGRSVEEMEIRNLPSLEELNISCGWDLSECTFENLPVLKRISINCNIDIWGRISNKIKLKNVNKDVKTEGNVEYEILN